VPKDMEPTFNIKCASYKATENALQMVSTIWLICAFAHVRLLSMKTVYH
jgi:hypothetical protein